MIVEITKKDLQNYYDSIPETIRSDMQKHIAYDLDMFDNPLVDMKYFFIYNDNDKFVGAGILVFKDFRQEKEFEYEKMLLNKEKTALIKNCFVNSKYRGNGYFSQLMHAMENSVKDKGYKNITLSTRKTNVMAQNIYKHLGYEKLDTEYNYPDTGLTCIFNKKLS